MSSASESDGALYLDDDGVGGSTGGPVPLSPRDQSVGIPALVRDAKNLGQLLPGSALFVMLFKVAYEYHASQSLCVGYSPSEDVMLLFARYSPDPGNPQC